MECYHQNKAFQPQEKYSKAFPLFWCLTRSYIFITLTFLGIFPMHQGIGLLGDKSRRTGLFVFHLPRLPLAMPACLLGAWANPSFYPRSNNQRAAKGHRDLRFAFQTHPGSQASCRREAKAQKQYKPFKLNFLSCFVHF